MGLPTKYGECRPVFAGGVGVNSQAVQELFTRLRTLLPQPSSELEHGSHFELLVAVMLSAQSTDKQVNKVTTRLFAKANTPQAILDLGEEGLREEIKSIGLYNTKAANIYKTCAILLERHHGAVPAARTALQAFPGVGRKSANIVLNMAFGEDTIAVDTHVFRVANRTGLAAGNTPQAVEQGLLKITPPEFRKDAHHWLVLHGRYVCTARHPHCWECPIRDLCEYPDKNEAA